LMEYFRMSVRFNKSTLDDFGLIKSDEGLITDKIDRSIWKKTELLDLGWGNENGFYKTPLPGFDDLSKLVLEFSYNKQNNNIDTINFYGALAILLQLYPVLLLDKVEEYDLKGKFESKKDKEFFELVKLNIQPKISLEIATRNKNNTEVEHIKRWQKIFSKYL